MGKYLIIISLLFFYFSNDAQSLGLLEESSVVLEKASLFSDKKSGDLPIKASLRKYCPAPKDQMSLNSCSSWATVYGALTIDYCISKGYDTRQLANEHSFMPLSVHNHLIKNVERCNSVKGTGIEDVLLFLKETGAIPFKKANIKLSNCDTIFESQERVKIRDFKLLFDLSDSLQKIALIKQAIYLKKPVIIGFKVFRSFEKLIPGLDTWFPINKMQDVELGPHAMLVVGYDDVNETFEIMNSKGTSWGSAGFVKVKYKDFIRYSIKGFLLSYIDDINIDKSNSSLAFELRYFTEDGKKSIKNEKTNFFKFSIDTSPNSYICCYSYQDEQLDLLLNSKFEKKIISPSESDMYYSLDSSKKSGIVIIQSEDNVLPPRDINTKSEMLSWIDKQNIERKDYDSNESIVKHYNSKSNNAVIVRLNE